ncbi:DUF7544 domain-containing protein [Streptomyces corynorhini]|uniref:DUF7847 domain-containing protein n=1 Tax=Streptomyces corynorhini TaxID=2282652 RepID=A0A370B215_9ACTN|nr:hypothetical protein [Streptomyces corynorhini]RDG35880.1 hypothetical protein DVH02_22975 [Streptomyces corynorhini]
MNDTPGWASPGSAPSDGQDATVPGPAAPADDTASKWSASQPPAGQWSPPSPPGAGPGAPRRPAPGWGNAGPGGAPGGGWGKPPAAKPGVIPLRPLSVGEILDGAVSTMRTHWRTVLSVSLVVAVISQIGEILVQRYLVPEPTTIDQDASASEVLRQTAESTQSNLLAEAPSLVITLIGTIFVTAVLTMVVSRSVLGRPVTLADAWNEARPRLLQLLGLTLLLPFASVVVLTIGILPGLLVGSAGGAVLAFLGGMAALLVIIWLMVRFTLASPALMLERQGVLTALRRSAKLVSGSWWRVFGIQVLTFVLVMFVTLVIALPFSVLAMTADGSFLDSLLSGDTPDFSWPFLIITGIGSVIALTVTYPISAGVSVLLYVDQRIRREALDLELARAAGVSGDGTQQPGHGSPRG